MVKPRILSCDFTTTSDREKSRSPKDHRSVEEVKFSPSPSNQCMIISQFKKSTFARTTVPSRSPPRTVGNQTSTIESFNLIKQDKFQSTLKKQGSGSPSLTTSRSLTPARAHTSGGYKVNVPYPKVRAFVVKKKIVQDRK